MAEAGGRAMNFVHPLSYFEAEAVLAGDEMG
jgi:hypothetical protein